MTHLNQGDLAPDFTLPRDDGSVFTLSAHRGKRVVLFFYPEDDSGGCTDENVEFSNLLDEYEAAGAVVQGISPDDIAKHQKFRAKYDLRIPLIADPERQAMEAYGLWQLKKLYGREFMGLIRTSFIIGTDGKIERIIRATRIKGHAAKVLEALRENTASA
ncbi:bacterioferritin [Devosia sp. Leaf420]|uniref:peroxiredoxin n=1 Tax=Devosia sp. Leaf420 TaxID=1736374 RepID=UPI0007124C88|nr:peroxiredoxin [Devosia sp. Leaf420]KQT51223.1 bacterioferritin [Devosia sp. Leaf420]